MKFEKKDVVLSGNNVKVLLNGIINETVTVQPGTNTYFYSFVATQTQANARLRFFFQTLDDCSIVIDNVCFGDVSTTGGGTITANANVSLTGISMTSSIGTPNITAWAEIDPNVSNVWTEVDLAA